MMKYIILENEAKALAHLYCRLIEKENDKEIVLIKCDYNMNIREEEVVEKETKKIKNFIKEKKPDITMDKPRIEIMITVEDLLNSVVNNNLFMKEDILLMDISLFERSDEESDNDYTEYSSVQLAEKLLKMDKIISANVRFYTKATSKSDPEAFSAQTGGKWYVPVLRPIEFYAPGGENEVEIFFNKILRKGL